MERVFHYFYFPTHPLNFTDVRIFWALALSAKTDDLSEEWNGFISQKALTLWWNSCSVTIWPVKVLERKIIA